MRCIVPGSGHFQGFVSVNFDGNFQKIGEVDVRELQSLCAQLTDEHWDYDAVRQSRYEVHQDTKTIPLVYDPDFRHTQPTRLPPLEVFGGAIRPALAMVADYFEQSDFGRVLVSQNGQGYFIRATIVLLKAGGKIGEHADNNFSLAHSHRVHVPVITNDEVKFNVGGEARNLKEGEVVEINNRRQHSVDNDGDEDRIHLILDFVLSGEQCCCSAKQHPGIPCSPSACEATDRQQIACVCYPEAEVS